jgi:excinuclease ABC subunit A
MNRAIQVFGACEHNLKNIDISIPKRGIAVLTGPSGSGKSSLAVDTIAAESKYRMFLVSRAARPTRFLPYRPSVQTIKNLPPAICLERTVLKMNRHTIASFIGLERILFDFISRKGVQHCPKCSGQIERKEKKEIIEEIKENFSSKLIAVTALLGLRADHAASESGQSDLSDCKVTEEMIYNYIDRGYTNIFIDKKSYDADVFTVQIKQLIAENPPIIEIVVDRFAVKKENDARLADAVTEAMKLQEPALGVHVLSSESNESTSSSVYFSETGICRTCGHLSFPINRSHFNLKLSISPADYIQDPRQLQGLSSLSIHQQSEFLNIQLGDFSFNEFLKQEIEQLVILLNNSDLCSPALSERFSHLLRPLSLLKLEYLTPLRSLASLSHGEQQRLRIAKQLINPLEYILYVIDEPSGGLHAGEIETLIKALQEVRGSNNTLLLTEHNYSLIDIADKVIVLGPDSGAKGGSVVFTGSPDDFFNNSISSENKIQKHRPGPATDKYISIKGASLHNLKNISASFPIGALTSVTGVSGSGKTNLIIRTLFPALKNYVKRTSVKQPVDWSIFNIENMLINHEISYVAGTPVTDQVASSLSFVASFVGIFSIIRNLFSELEISKIRGYSADTFSLTGKSKGKAGRCEVCRGSGVSNSQTLNSSLQSSICPRCRGTRFRKEILDVRFKNLSIADILNLTAVEALDIIGNVPGSRAILKAFQDFNLGYLTLGQQTARLSSGEIQRLRILKGLAKLRHSAVYIFDQPTLGLNSSEVLNLIRIFRKITSQNNTIIAIEHNLNFVRASDYILDLGPGPGMKGGQVIAAGSIEDILKTEKSLTGKMLSQST